MSGYRFHDAIDAEPFLAWVREQLADCGGNQRACAARLGVDANSVKRWADGLTTEGEPMLTVRTKTADKVLTKAGWTLAMIYPNEADESVEGFCPTCCERTITGPDRRCLWCDSKIRVRRPSRRRISDDQVRAAHRLYMRPLSLPELGELLWGRLGYGSPKSCEIALQTAFHALGLHVRNQGWNNVKHGMARRDGDLAAYYRARRRAAGGARRCRGRKTWYPGKGEPCSLYAMHDSDYCVHHDPTRAEERNEHLRRMRERRAA